MGIGYCVCNLARLKNRHVSREFNGGGVIARKMGKSPMKKAESLSAV